MISLNPTATPSIIYRWVSERLGDVPKVTQLGWNRVRIFVPGRVLVDTFSVSPEPCSSLTLEAFQGWQYCCQGNRQPQAPCWHQPQSETLSKQSEERQEEKKSEEQDPERWCENSCVTNLSFSKICQISALQSFYCSCIPKIILNNYLPLLCFLSW